jgi:parallel beta-helix repeat protein
MEQTILLAFRSMRTGLTLLALLSLTFFCTSTAKAAPTPVTHIISSACNYEIAASGDYKLDTDIGPCAPGEDGILIYASDVTLHLNGHTINGSNVPGNCDGYIGIFVSSANQPTNITGVNVVGPGVLSNWQIGFGSSYSAKSSVSFTKVTANCAAPISSFGFIIDGTTSRWILLGNVVDEPGENTAGFGVSGKGHYVAGNRVDDTLEVVDCSNCIVFGNFASNDSAGIYVYGGSNNQIVANTTENNTGYSGILLTGGTTGNFVSLNRSLGNTPFDMEDDNPGCGTDKWDRNLFKTANERCIH